MEALVLTFYQFTVKSVFCQQLLVTALLLHRAVTQDDDMICLLHHAHVSGYQQHCAVVGLVQQRLVDLMRESAELNEATRREAKCGVGD